MKERTLDNYNSNSTKKNIPDICVFGNADAWQLLCKASSESEGWMKSTKAMQVMGGCIVQVTTQQINPDGSHSLAEAVCFVPGVNIIIDCYGNRSLG